MSQAPDPRPGALEAERQALGRPAARVLTGLLISTHRRPSHVPAERRRASPSADPATGPDATCPDQTSPLVPHLRARTLANVLTITVGPVNVGSGRPGGTLSASLGTVTVADSRTGTRSWTATVSASSFTTGGGTTPQTITNGNIAYWSGPVTASAGAATRTPGQPTAAQRVPLSSPATAFSASEGPGPTSTSWAPTIVITIPAAAVADTYTGTITHSVA